MNILIKKKSVLFSYLLLFVFCNYNVTAQRVRANLSIGACAYLGELQNQTIFLEQASPAFSVGASYDLKSYFRLRGDLSVMQAKGDDKLSVKSYTKQRNLNFKTTIYEAALLGEFDYLNFFLNKQTKLTPYSLFGFSIFRFNPTTIDRNGNKVYLHSIGTEGQMLGNPNYNYRNYSLIQFNYQLGGGIRYALDDKTTIGFELSIRRLNTDYLDDVHNRTYVDPSEFTSKGQTLAAQLSFRGDELGYTFTGLSGDGRGSNKSEDFYYTCQFRLTYRLDNIHLGNNDYYFFSNKKAMRSQRNPPRL